MSKRRSPKSRELFQILLNRGYPEVFCQEVANSLNTDFTAERMIGYLSYFETVRVEDLVDEMYAILSERDRFIEKKLTEKSNETYNRYLLEKKLESMEGQD